MLTFSIVIAAVLGVITGKFAYLYTHGAKLKMNTGAETKTKRVYEGIK